MTNATTKYPTPDPGRAGRRAPSTSRDYGLRDLVTLAIGCGEPGTELHDRYQLLRDALGVSTDLLRLDGGWVARTRGIIDPGRSTENGRHSALPRLAAEDDLISLGWPDDARDAAWQMHQPSSD